MSVKGNLKNRLTAFTASAVMAVSSLAGTAFTSVSAESDLGLDNYAKLMQYSLYFYDANYCGTGTGEKSHFSWRDDCHTDGTANGGFHDAGDGIICGLTEGFTASTLGWLYYEYKDEFQKTGTYAHYKDIMDEFVQFFKTCTTLDSNGNVTKFIYEIGDDGADHSKWRAPELMSRNSSEYYSTSDGASNVAAQYAAALAQHYINFGNEEDLKYAKALYEFAAKNRKMTYDQSTYSDKSVEDDIAWAAGWLYLATEEKSYLDANSKDTSGTNDWTNDYYYGGVWLGAAIINAEITGNWSKPVSYIQNVVNQNQDKFYVMNSWGSARHNTLMQTCAMIATKHKENSNADFSEWCKKQMNMILGDNNANVCLVVGYNDISATSPHHRAASGLYVGDGWEEWGSWDGNYASVPTSHVLYGALCGGPTSEDFNTFRKLDAKDATSNEVALDYQVGLVGASVGLYSYYGTGEVVDTIGDEVTVYDEEIAVAQGKSPEQEETTTTTTTTTTATTTTATTEEIVTTTTANAIPSATLGVPVLKDGSSSDFHVGDEGVIPFWSGNDTWQIQDITVDGKAVKVTSHGEGGEISFICEEEGTATVNVTCISNYSLYSSVLTATINVKPKEETGNVVYGDADNDGEININDAVLIMQSIANPDRYSLTEKGRKNADVVDGDGVTNSDALAIQLVESKKITADVFPITSAQLNETDSN